jgi:sugar transferase (PEP-CTERM/EpsH1 system associated)
MTPPPPTIAHIIYRLDFGGLENGLVNLINRIPPEQYQHAIICMTGYSDFAARITNPAVSLHALFKREGKDPAVYLRLWKLLRGLRPAIVHTRNLAALEGGVVARFSGVPGRVHGEHGRDSYDIDGSNLKYRRLRRLCAPFIQRFIPLSQDLEHWLTDDVGIPAAKIRQIYNGVDSERFQPFAGGRRPLPLEGFAGDEEIVIGTVGRVQEVKDQLTLARAVAELAERNPDWRRRLRLVIVGEGPMMPELQALVRSSGIEEISWLAGARDDIPRLLQGLDLFVLPSKAEGISNTILEAMASGLPVLATGVGGNPELVVEGETGRLVAPEAPDAMADAIEGYLQQPELLARHGRAGRQRVETSFSMEAMVNNYLAVYRELIK